MAANASVTLALDLGDTVKRIDGTEVPLRAPWRRAGGSLPEKRDDDLPGGALHAGEPTPGPQPSKGQPADATGVTVQEARAVRKGRPAPQRGAGRGAAGEASEGFRAASGRQRCPAGARAARRSRRLTAARRTT